MSTVAHCIRTRHILRRPTRNRSQRGTCRRTRRVSPPGPASVPQGRCSPSRRAVWSRTCRRRSLSTGCTACRGWCTRTHPPSRHSGTARRARRRPRHQRTAPAGLECRRVRVQGRHRRRTSRLFPSPQRAPDVERSSNRRELGVRSYSSIPDRLRRSNNRGLATRRQGSPMRSTRPTRPMSTTHTSRCFLAARTRCPLPMLLHRTQVLLPCPLPLRRPPMPPQSCMTASLPRAAA